MMGLHLDCPNGIIYVDSYVEKLEEEKKENLRIPFEYIPSVGMLLSCSFQIHLLGFMRELFAT